ncbi:Jtb (predicted) [Pycnogonum litorale]
MIESCSLKRMLILLIILIGLSVFIVIIENYYTPTTASRRQNQSTENGCWLKEPFTIKSSCSLCSDFEKVSKYSSACERTGYKETVICEKTGDTHRSCDLAPWLEERNFWIFEGVTAIIGIFSSIIVKIRQRQLDKQFLERIEKQVAAGI